MFIEELSLRNYRNYENVSLSFRNKVNVLIGENAQGKTNVMESIYVLAMAKSHRTSTDKDLIQWDKEYAKIKGTIQKKEDRIPMELVLSKKGKKAKVNHLEQAKLSRYVGHFNVVMFAPEDLTIVKGSPQVRRRFLDMELGQVSPIYLHTLGQYMKVLQQRNSLLKKYGRQPSKLEEMYDVYTEQLVQCAVPIMAKRFQFIRLLETWAAPIHAGITRDKEALRIFYKPSVDVSAESDLTMIEAALRETFVKKREREWERGVTLAGPHRDDLTFSINDRDVQTFGSQGQQRTTALSVKLAEIELIHGEIGEYPVLLLDDVLSELDDHRQSHLLHTIQGKVQTFVTTTSTEGIHHETLEEAETFHVHQGKVTKT
ncbi:DNA replication/repair protein RecF [Bacillus fonticola]|uniref:DNA replication/repair protein RecF n=1 Tax=Bacillus fonticola TaxID=2728853 RepID=UPI001473BEBA|nr:DNA replication/repair protein RecF [Bacillus fonticola]